VGGIFGNIRGVCTQYGAKLPYLQALAAEKGSFLISLAESHLNESIDPTSSQLPGFQQFRADRTCRQGGGVITYIREDLAVTCDLSHSNNYVETQCVSIPSAKLAVITMYRPPGCPTDKFRESVRQVREWISSFENSDSPLPSIILNGDFNFGFMGGWDIADISGLEGKLKSRAEDGLAVSQDKSQALLLLDLVQEHLMTQVVKEGTRLDAILDLVFSNDQDLM
jgi:exonuclease III